MFCRPLDWSMGLWIINEFFETMINTRYSLYFLQVESDRWLRQYACQDRYFTWFKARHKESQEFKEIRFVNYANLVISEDRRCY